MSSSSSLHLLLLLTMMQSLPLVCVTAISCPSQNFTCGNTTLDIVLPFFTNKTSSQCTGLHYIDCINFVPIVSFKEINYLYPVTDISIHNKTITIYDPNFSSYFRGSDCVFLYDFRNPVPGFVFNSFSVSPNSGESFFNCKSDHDFNPDIFRLKYNLSLCKDYSLHYSGDYGKQSLSAFPNYCSNSSDLWFYWKLSFDGNGGELSLLAAGFLPRWVQHCDCFSCEFAASRNCSGFAKDPTCSCNSSCQGKKKKKKKKGIIIGMSVTAGVLLISILCFIGYCRHHRRRQKQQRSLSSAFLSYPSTTTGLPLSDKGSELTGYPYQTHIFTYDELLEATNSFNTSMEIGDGGFGTVYKGLLFDGRTVAVKRFHESNFRRAEQFANEIVILSRFRHNNLVSLYGCTSPMSRELLLVYEYIPNGTVADHLFGPRAAEGRLTWPRRLSVAVETAAALAYLHAVDPPIIHRDVKTGNILLDAEFHVKVTDFGLSRHIPRDGATHVSTAPQGTPGYLDPEYHRSYQLTDRSDVYSFGVVLAELISSKPAVDIGRDRAEINLSNMAVNRIQSGNLEDLVDKKLGYEFDAETMTTMRLVAELTFRCLQADREMRPAIKEVLEVLEGLQKGATFDSEKMGHFDEQVVGNAGVDKGGGAERPVLPDSVTENWVTGVSFDTT